MPRQLGKLYSGIMVVPYESDFMEVSFDWINNLSEVVI